MLVKRAGERRVDFFGVRDELACVVEELRNVGGDAEGCECFGHFSQCVVRILWEKVGEVGQDGGTRL